MKSLFFFFLSSLLLITSCNKSDKKYASSNLDFLDRPANEKKPALHRLNLGKIKPAGWIKSQIERDIENGLVGVFDKLTPEEMEDDLYASKRRTEFPTETNWLKEKHWWRGEQQGYWRDGLLRNAVLVDDKADLNKIKDYVEHILESQDEDGYIGIYSEKMRFSNFEGNGELWTQSRLFHVMLGYYEISQDKRVLDAVAKAVDRTMKDFNSEAKNPFDPPIYGGVAHGLQIGEDVAWLYKLTGDKKYRDYTIWLYKAFSMNPKRDNDIHYNFVSDPDEPFVGHAAHTFEHLRVLLDAWYYSGAPELEKAFDNYCKKLDKVILPSGAGFGFENLWGLEADPDSTPVEYCAITELELSSIYAAELTGKTKFADIAEKLFYNAAQGARLADCKAVTYCKPDNCYALEEKHIGYFNPEKGIGYTHNDERYKYSPTHIDVAECCAPQSTRAYPYFVSNMWMKSDKGIAAMLYGPCVVKTEINGVAVTINEITEYPFSDEITIEIIPESESEALLDISLRIPSYCQDMEVKSENADVTKDGDFYIVSGRWKAEDKINISLNPTIEEKLANNGEKYIQRGVLVYALDIPSNEKAVGDYPLEGFHDYHYLPKKNVDYSLQLLGKDFSYSSKAIDGNPWLNSPVNLSGKMYSNNKNSEVDVELVPVGNTILRRITFPKK